MNELRFCSCWGKILERGYNYCPHCGTQCRDLPAFEVIVDASFKELERVQFNRDIQRLEKMETILEELEQELNTFLAVKSS
jgi:NAD(P)H-dependent flavin oxidoreductase YrpB (nitropropane dioxygenase family)